MYLHMYVYDYDDEIRLKKNWDIDYLSQIENIYQQSNEIYFPQLK